MSKEETPLGRRGELCVHARAHSLAEEETRLASVASGRLNESGQQSSGPEPVSL